VPGLFDPLTVNRHTLRNRVVYPPIATEHATDRGEVTDWHLNHYADIARGGPGLLIVEHSFMRMDGRASTRQIGIYDDSLLPGLSRLAKAIKDGGAVACIQLAHAGAQATREVTGSQPIAASAIPFPEANETPHALTAEEIQALVRDYAAAAERAQAAGFDGVEIHGAHGYLLSEFVSPLTNHRKDEYGGSLENRVRLSYEVIRAVKEAVGDGFLVLYRLGADDFTPGGLTGEDALKIAPMLQEAGLDILDVSGGLAGSGRDMFKEQGYLVPLASRIKRMVQIPVIGIGNVRDPSYADEVIREGLVDLTAVGRAQLANHQWVADARKALASA
jgi:NADPH2 dehydrogenase